MDAVILNYSGLLARSQGTYDSLVFDKVCVSVAYLICKFSVI